MNLSGLHDVVAPGPVSWLPATAAWLVVLLALVAIAAWVGYRLLVRWRANRYRREALAELTDLSAGLDHDETRSVALARLPTLVKRVALHVAPRAEVASLSGDAWLRFLDGTWSGNAFTSGPGRVLPLLGYGSAARIGAIPRDELGQLLELLRRWIADHHSPAADGAPASGDVGATERAA